MASQKQAGQKRPTRNARPKATKPLPLQDTERKLGPREKVVPVLHTLRLLLAGQDDYIMLQVSREEHDRVMRIIQHNSSSTFILIETLQEMIGLRLESISLVNFCFDPFVLPAPQPEDEDLSYQIELYLRGRKGPLQIDVEPDVPFDPEKEGEACQLNNLLMGLELSTGDMSATHFFIDVDGEPVVLMERNLDLVRIPKYLIPEGQHGSVLSAEEMELN